MNEVLAVNVPAAMLWREPGEKRPHDRLILGADADPAAWADGMDEEMRLWLVGQVESQLLYGERVLVLERADGWLRVAALSQGTDKDARGYPGWLPAAQVAASPEFAPELDDLVALVTAPRAMLHGEPGTLPLFELSWPTRLPLLAEEGGWLTVRRPDGGVGFLARSEAARESAGFFDGYGMVDAARRFFGLRYVWGGTSAWGFDCSGLTFRLYQSQGIAIPRDADEQAAAGRRVERDDLQPGDLLFFAGPGGQGDIHHVGVYAGGDMMVHAPNSRSAVREESFAAGVYGEEFWGARRYR